MPDRRLPYVSNTPKGMPATPRDLYEGTRVRVRRVAETLGNLLTSKTAPRTTDIELPVSGRAEVSGRITPATIINVYNRKVLQNPDGTASTMDTESANFDGQEILYPRVVDGKRLTSGQAQDRYRRTGQHFGIFSSPEAASAYAEELHEDEASGRFRKR